MRQNQSLVMLLGLSMNNNELNKKFEATGKTARDFIRWVENETGVKFSDGEISDWKGEGKRPRRLTKAPKALFILFFKSLGYD